MNRLKTFRRGGVHPKGRKELTSRFPIRNAHIPATAVIPMSQSIGAPAECVVAVGDEVKEGMVIGRATGLVSAAVHSSIPGVVREIREFFLPQGIRTKAVVIDFAGEFEKSGKPLSKRTWEDLDQETLRRIIADMGIVGLGGATFPTYVKYSPPAEKQIDYLIINGVECEPFLTADHRLMLEKSDEILDGMRVAQRITQASNVMIAIEANKPDAIEVLTNKIKERALSFQVVPLAVKYPQGDEKMILKALLGREVPGNKLPLDVGAVISNVGTIFAIYEAVVWQKPLYERVLTVTGSLVARPGNLKTRIGTPIGELIEECGGLRGEPAKIVLGGPMMGFCAADLSTPVTKSVSGIIVLSRKETSLAVNNPCIRCGRCITACPWGLHPTVMFKHLEHREYARALEDGLLDCKECGCCAFVCPAEIPLAQSFKTGKIMAKKTMSEATK